MIRGIHHIALHTRDLDRIVAFYRDVIGFTVVKQGSWDGNEAIDSAVGLEDSAARNVMMSAGNCYLEIFEYSRPTLERPILFGPAITATRTYAST